MDDRLAHPKLRPFFGAAELLLSVSVVAYHRAQKKLRRRGPSGYGRRPGTDTPFWNILATEVRRAARPAGTKARLARYLGIPRQRMTEFLSSKRRLPDGEITLRLLHWLDCLKQGRDIAL